MSQLDCVLRNFKHGDTQIFQHLVNTAYHNLESLTEERVATLTSPPLFNAKGFFIAEKKGFPVGCIGVFNLRSKRHLVIQYLAVNDALRNIPVVHSLIEAALKYAESRSPKLLKAVTMMIQPYVEAYQQFGFKPVRRILRVAWDPIQVPEKPSKSRAAVREVSKAEVDEASCVFVAGLRPYWDWYIEEGGGEKAVVDSAREWIKQYPCLAAKVNNRIVGVAGIVPRPESKEAAFSGVIVLPEFRMSGIGSALMIATLRKAKELGCRRLVVHTLAYLDALAPGAVLYLKSGGRVEAEYLHLVRALA